jgi:hypothetical protein
MARKAALRQWFDFAHHPELVEGLIVSELETSATK